MPKVRALYLTASVPGKFQFKRRIAHFQARSLLTHLSANAMQELSTSHCVPCFADTEAFGKDIAKMGKPACLFCENHKNLLLSSSLWKGIGAAAPGPTQVSSFR